jgi:hypothetical protein
MLYLAYFNRIPDHAGLTGWVNFFRSGGTSPPTLEQISGAFAQSAEFQLTYGTLSNTQFVNLLYLNILGRTPDPAGLQGWVNQLNAGMSRGKVMVGFSESLEFQDKTSNNVFVIMMYEGMLRRAAEQAGYDHWVNLLNGGMSRSALTGGFLGSPEYRMRFQLP